MILDSTAEIIVYVHMSTIIICETLYSVSEVNCMAHKFSDSNHYFLKYF